MNVETIFEIQSMLPDYYSEPRAKLQEVVVTLNMKGLKIQQVKHPSYPEIFTAARILLVGSNGDYYNTVQEIEEAGFRWEGIVCFHSQDPKLVNLQILDRGGVPGACRTELHINQIEMLECRPQDLRTKLAQINPRIAF